MKKNSCEEAMEEVVGLACERFGVTWVLDEEKYDILKQYCSAFDKMAEEFDASEVNFSIDEETMEPTIMLKCPEAVIENPKHFFFQLLQRSVQNECYASGDDIVISMTFGSIWYHI